MWIIVSIILFILLVISCFIVKNFLLKNEQLEDLAENQQRYLDKFKETIDFCNQKLSEIDSKGSFEADDEVGWFFEEVKALQTLINQYKDE